MRGDFSPTTNHSQLKEIIMTKANAINVTYQQFAEGIGRTDRMTLEASLAWHKAYVKLDKASQSSWRDEFVLNYIVGKLDITMKQAEIIYAQTRAERKADDEKAVNAGGAKFRHHISRPEKSDGKKVVVKFTREQTRACDEALAAFEAETLAEQIKMLRAYLATLETK
jgi:hypothetical protein